MMGSEWIEFVSPRLSELWLRTGEHLMLTGVSVAFAIAIGIPLGILALRFVWLRGPLVGAVGILQTIPSLAMLAILLAILHQIGTLPAIIALILYALLPIVRNTLAGLQEVAPEVLEAARGIGMTDRQVLWMVRLPLARPYIIAGIRTAAVLAVGIATLSAFIGAGGLGQFINRGLALSDSRLILLGAIPAAILALIVDGSIGTFQWGMKPLRQSERTWVRSKLKAIALLQPLILIAAGLIAGLSHPSVSMSDEFGTGPAGTIRIGSKNFTEQFVLGELMAQMIEHKTNLRVERQFNLGGTMICHGALKSGEIDIYPEYTGTGLTAILDREPVSEAGKALDIVRKAYREKWDLEWLNPFGFNNTYAITVREQDAKEHGWKTIADLASVANKLRAGFTAEFAERPDGYPGLKDAYGFSFGDVKDLDPALMYEAIANNEVDVICAFATDGRIEAYGLQPLEDNKGFFPPYEAAPVVQTRTLQQFPALREALAPLTGLFTDATMQQLNYQVDEEKRNPSEVAKEFLRSKDLIN